MNYYQLQSAIQDYTENQFPLTVLANGNTVSAAQQINRFIEQAELRIFNTVQLPSLRKNVTGTVSPNTPYLACPDDFLSSFSLAAIDPVTNEYEFLLNKDVNFIRQAYPSPTDTGKPQYYALFGPTVSANTITDELSIIFGPTPNSNYGVELHYYYYPQSIVDAGDGRTWLGDNYSPVLLYGTLIEAYIFMKGEADMMAAYEKKFQDALAQLNRLGTGLERGDAYRDGQAKIPVSP